MKRIVAFIVILLINAGIIGYDIVSSRYAYYISDPSVDVVVIALHVMALILAAVSFNIVIINSRQFRFKNIAYTLVGLAFLWGCRTLYNGVRFNLLPFVDYHWTVFLIVENVMKNILLVATVTMVSALIIIKVYKEMSRSYSIPIKRMLVVASIGVCILTIADYSFDIYKEHENREAKSIALDELGLFKGSDSEDYSLDSFIEDNEIDISVETLTEEEAEYMELLARLSEYDDSGKETISEVSTQGWEKELKAFKEEILISTIRLFILFGLIISITYSRYWQQKGRH